jgi:hypothetical protein
MSKVLSKCLGFEGVHFWAVEWTDSDKTIDSVFEKRQIHLGASSDHYSQKMKVGGMTQKITKE